MNFNHLLLTSIPQTEKLVAYGFEQKDDCFVLKKNLNAEFYAVVSFSKNELNAEVFETETGESESSFIYMQKNRLTMQTGIDTGSGQV